MLGLFPTAVKFLGQLAEGYGLEVQFLQGERCKPGDTRTFSRKGALLEAGC